MSTILNGKEQSAVRAQIGEITDGHSDATIYGYAVRDDEHNHGVTGTYPALAAPVTLTAGGTAWAAHPAPTEIIPATTIASDFDIHWVTISGISANGDYELCLYSGSANTKIATLAFSRNAVQSQEGSVTLITPLMLSANDKVSGSISSSNAAADTADVKVSYHTY